MGCLDKFSARRQIISSSMRILCLHGFRQNANSFRKRTGAVRKALESKCNCTLEYIDAPHTVEPAGEILIEETGIFLSPSSRFLMEAFA